MEWSGGGTTAGGSDDGGCVGERTLIIDRSRRRMQVTYSSSARMLTRPLYIAD